MQLSLITALALLVLTAVGFLAGRSRALAIAEKDGSRLHSLPGYHGRVCRDSPFWRPTRSPGP